MQSPLHMVRRDYWIERIEGLWRLRSIVWLTGVRRVGKTCPATSLADIEYFDRDELAVRASLRDPMPFLAALWGKRVVLDEIHRLDDTSAVLKNAADHYPGVRIVATGSSRISASRKFRDALTGRKYELHLRPLVLPDLARRESGTLACCRWPTRAPCGALPRLARAA